MHPKVLLDACAELVRLTLTFEHPADAVVSRFFRDNRGLGPRERATLAETDYTVLRKKLLFDHMAPSGSGPKERRLAILGFYGPRDFLKSALSEPEKAWLDQCDAVDRASLSERHRSNLPEWLAEPLKAQVGGDFMALADDVRYPAAVRDADLREIKRIKARVENERLPQGAPRERHLKLGPGGLSDVEWLVQLLQLEHAHAREALRTTSTLQALDAATEAGLVPTPAAQRLGEAWRLASRLRSANTLLGGQTSDVLPADRRQLDGIGRLLEFPPRSASAVEEAWMRASRRARRSFEKLFYG